MTKDEMPVGFAMKLAANPKAMQKFATFSEEEKQKFIAGTHAVKSSDEMQRYVESLANGKQ